MQTRRRWTLPAEALDRDLMARLGNLKQVLTLEEPTTFTIDLSGTEWGDPVSLLMIGSIVASYRQEDCTINFDFGRESTSTQEHKTWLKFLATQGFVEVFGRCGNLHWQAADRRVLDAPWEAGDLRDVFSLYPRSIHFEGADCVHARLVPISPFRDEKSDRFYDFVDALISEAGARASDSAFGSDPFVRDRIFIKLRKLLYELVLNVIEHAYEPDENGFAGVYVRIRGGRPGFGAARERWDRLRASERVRSPALRQFEPNLYADWLEVFVCDAGCGLLHHLHNWGSGTEDPAIRKIVARSKRSKRPLWAIAPALFKRSMSRFHRHDTYRTAVTGLQYLGYMLGFDRDYGRIYTDGQWIGGAHPWPEDRIGSQELTVAPARYPAPGTVHIIHIQPTGGRGDYHPDTWVTADVQGRDLIIGALRENLQVRDLDNDQILFIDHRDDVRCPVPAPGSPLETRLANGEQLTLVLRPPNSLSKRELGSWISPIAGTMNIAPQWGVRTFVLADLTPFQSLILVEALKTFHVHSQSRCDIFLVSEQWTVSALTTSQNSGRLTIVLPKAHAFIFQQVDGFSVPQLALYLRLADSRAFWQDTPQDPLKRIFKPIRVDWPGSNPDEHVTLDGYLDLPTALSSRSRYRSCWSAIKRLIELFPDLVPVATDDLLSSLVGSVSRSRYNPPTSEEPQAHVLVGSISVTASTLRRFRNRYDIHVKQEITLLLHQSALRRTDNLLLQALLWMPPSYTLELWPSNYARIPGTPFAAPGGARAISVVRFEPRIPGKAPFTSSYYARSPNETYAEFERYKILKLGHWTYGNRHDLMTINVGQAVEFSALEDGPLISWLREQFRHLFRSTDVGLSLPAVLLVYPSYSVSDHCVTFFRENPSFEGLLPAEKIIPIKFIGEHTVSPLLVSPLAREQIQAAIHASGRQRPATVIFDTVAITGKHFQELRQLLVDAGSGTVHTVAILDRTGLPVRTGVMGQFTARHRRYWRWDVPRLGHTGECLLCSALGRASALDQPSLLPSHATRLREWDEIWRPRPVSSAWHEGGLLSVPFGREVTVAFGLDEDEAGQEVRNEVPHRNSTSLAAMVAELTRMTTKAETAMSKAGQLAGLAGYPQIGVNSREAAVEVLAAQILLFRDELAYWERRDRFIMLLRLLWDCWPENHATALGALCLNLVDDALVPEIWLSVKRELLTKQPLGNADIVLAVLSLQRRYQASLDGLIEPQSDDTTAIERYNHILLSNTRYIELVVGIFEILGFGDTQSHGIFLYRKLTILSTLRGTPPADLVETLRDVQQHLRNLVIVLSRIDFGRLFLDSSNLPEPRRDADELEAHLNAIPSIKPPNTEALVQLEEWAERVRAMIFGQDGRSGVARGYQRTFFVEIRKGVKKATLLDSVITEISADWSATLSRRHTVPYEDRWYSEGTCICPIVRTTDTTAWPTDLCIVFDPLVREAVREIIENVVHSNGPSKNPWSDGPEEADMWWRAELEPPDASEYLRLDFANSSEDRVVILKPRPSRAGLQRVGGRISMEFDPSRRQIVTSMWLPLANALIKEGTQ